MMQCCWLLQVFEFMVNWASAHRRRWMLRQLRVQRSVTPGEMVAKRLPADLKEPLYRMCFYWHWYLHLTRLQGHVRNCSLLDFFAVQAASFPAARSHLGHKCFSDMQRHILRLIENDVWNIMLHGLCKKLFGIVTWPSSFDKERVRGTRVSYLVP